LQQYSAQAFHASETIELLPRVASTSYLDPDRWPPNIADLNSVD